MQVALTSRKPKVKRMQTAKFWPSKAASRSSKAKRIQTAKFWPSKASFRSSIVGSKCGNRASIKLNISFTPIRFFLPPIPPSADSSSHSTARPIRSPDLSIVRPLVCPIDRTSVRLPLLPPLPFPTKTLSIEIQSIALCGTSCLAFVFQVRVPHTLGTPF